MSENESVINHINEQVEVYSARYSLNVGKAFMVWYAIEALGLEEDIAFSAVSIDGGNDKGIDLFYVDDETQTVIIAQGKYHRQANYNARPGTLYELIHSTDWFDNPQTVANEGRTELEDAAVDYREALAKSYSVDYHFVYMGPPKRELEDSASQFNASSEPGQSRYARVINIELLRSIYEENSGFSTRIKESTIVLEKERVFRQKGQYGEAIVASIPGKELKRLYAEHRDSLFDRNVRLYLGARKGSVNAGLKETLESPAERNNFWAYNNGITFVCRDFDYDESDGRLKLTNFSIVNGCQTTVSIANFLHRDADEVEILARFIAAPKEQDVDSIIRFTNSQTKIRDWDLASQDKKQKSLKSELAQDPHPFFYELRLGEARHLNAAEKSRFTRDSKLQVIKPDVLAQRLAAFKGHPAYAYTEKSLLFTTHGKLVFPQDLQVEEVLLAWLAGEAADEAVQKELIAARQDKNQTVSRVLARGGKLAVMAILLNERNGSVYLSRIERVVAGSKNTRRGLDKYAALAMSYYCEVMEDLMSMGTDLNLAVRSQETFGRVQSKIRHKWGRESKGTGFTESLDKFV
jgi:hypothetical protein